MRSLISLMLRSLWSHRALRPSQNAVTLIARTLIDGRNPIRRAEIGHSDSRQRIGSVSDAASAKNSDRRDTIDLSHATVLQGLIVHIQIFYAGRQNRAQGGYDAKHRSEIP